MNKVIVSVVGIALAVFLVSKAFENFRDKSGANVAAPGATADPSAVAKKESKQVKEINPDKKLGAAGGLVRSFFKNWQYERYGQMHEQTVHSREKEVFVSALSQTPIHWQNLEILSETHSGDDWDVALSVEVTDLVSAFAACMVNVSTSPDPVPNKSAFRFSPNFLEIERFMQVKQTWKIVTLDKQLLIDMGGGESAVKRHTNIMNYVLDAPHLIVPPSGDEGLTAGQKTMAISGWMAIMMIDLDKEPADVKPVMVEAKGLSLKGSELLIRLLNKLPNEENDRNDQNAF